MNRKTVITCAGIAVALSAVVAPVAANAAAVTTPSSASSVSATDPVTAITQKKGTIATSPRVVVTVSFASDVRYELFDDAGRSVQSGSAGMNAPLTFNAGINGAESRDYTLVTTPVGGGESSSRTFTVDLAGQRIPAPLELTTTAEFASGTRQTAVRLQAVPGATVDYTVNGVTSTGVAGEDGIVTVPASFVVGANRISVVQIVDGVESLERSYGRTADR